MEQIKIDQGAEVEDGYYWMKESGEPWVVVEIRGSEMEFAGSDTGATRTQNGGWRYVLYGGALVIEHLVKIEPPNGQGNRSEPR